MSYIYTVKPITDAVKIAAQYDDFEIDKDGTTSVFGIDVAHWPAGVQIRSKEREDWGYIKVAQTGYSLPIRYFTEEHDKTDEPPEFIKNLYAAIKADCTGTSCFKCPLYYTGPVSCAQLPVWLEGRYPEL